MGGEPDRMRRAAAGASFLAAALVYLAGETVTARAWTAPVYSYARNWISDLGAPAVGFFHGRMVNSPLHAAMNAAFLADGLLFLLGAVLLVRAVPKASRFFLVLAAVHSAGNLLVGLVPETAAAPVGSLHLFGALLAIAGGNVAIMVGSRPAGVRWLGALLGTIGLASFLLLNVPAALAAGAGLVERLSVYPITAWELLAGLALLGSRGRAS